jgi:hypothetical protein
MKQPINNHTIYIIMKQFINGQYIKTIKTTDKAPYKTYKAIKQTATRRTRDTTLLKAIAK